ncbi:MAG: putative toxin-antitoxin system toxin component, PIN family [Verrucomicrobia bacterium]|nr:putative toxin-antitoxin system toxin component, PIN family [Verrucomicrobiota bacterium]
MNELLRVVFDTNILFSAVGWLGNPHRCVQAARQGRCLSLTCEPILSELAEKLRFKRGLDAQKVTEIEDEIRAFCNVIVIPGTLKIVAADPDDDAVLECAVIGRAQFLVSGDHHLLDLENHQGIQIVKAADFLTLIQSASKA